MKHILMGKGILAQFAGPYPDIDRTTKYPTVYLAGPIAGCSDEEAKGWRDKITVALEEIPGVTVLNPMKRDYRERDECISDDMIVEPDKQEIMESDFVIVNYSKPSVGTSMEIMFAYMLDKIIIVIAENVSELSPWLTYHADSIVSTLMEAALDVYYKINLGVL